jgi:hypothetical protein
LGFGSPRNLVMAAGRIGVIENLAAKSHFQAKEHFNLLASSAINDDRFA